MDYIKEIRRNNVARNKADNNIRKMVAELETLKIEPNEATPEYLNEIILLVRKYSYNFATDKLFNHFKTLIDGHKKWKKEEANKNSSELRNTLPKKSIYNGFDLINGGVDINAGVLALSRGKLISELGYFISLNHDNILDMVLKTVFEYEVNSSMTLKDAIKTLKIKVEHAPSWSSVENEACKLLDVTIRETFFKSKAGRQLGAFIEGLGGEVETSSRHSVYRRINEITAMMNHPLIDYLKTGRIAKLQKGYYEAQTVIIPTTTNIPCEFRSFINIWMAGRYTGNENWNILDPKAVKVYLDFESREEQGLKVMSEVYTSNRKTTANPKNILDLDLVGI